MRRDAQRRADPASAERMSLEGAPCRRSEDDGRRAGVCGWRRVCIAPRIPSLALRLARVANGALDLGFASANAHDWDVAAADVVLREAGRG